MPKGGLEPPFPYGNRFLKPTRMPFRHFGSLALDRPPAPDANDRLESSAGNPNYFSWRGQQITPFGTGPRINQR